MDEPLRLTVYRSSQIFEDVIVTYDRAVTCEDAEAEGKSQSKLDNDNGVKDKVLVPVRLNKRGLNAYLVSAYVATLKSSDAYRKAAVRSLLEFLPRKVTSLDVPVILIRLRTPRKQFLDYKWNDKLIYMALEQREADCAMSWLSTLGGAFSALGEEFQYCAEMAGKISMKQFQLALRLGNPLLVARCKLYAALSLIQQDYIRKPREIIIDVYRFAIAEKDVRLQNMCRGVWAKLKYCSKLRKQRRRLPQLCK